MISPYIYELWNGKEVVGTWTTYKKLQGEALYVPEVSPLKEEYNKSPKFIKIPIVMILLYDTGPDIRYARRLDIRRKSKRQLSILQKYFGMF